MIKNFFVKGEDGATKYAREDCNYSHDYLDLFAWLAAKEVEVGVEGAAALQKKAYRDLIRNDLFFIVCFVMGIERANHPFVVDRCREVETGPTSDTLDVWAREHFKSVVITQAETVQLILKNPELCHVIFSYKKPKAEDFLFAVRSTLEKPFLVQCFPDILYANADRESSSWSLQNGIIVKREGASRKEKTVEAYGLMEGMPTGGHWDRLVYDDIETADLAKNPEQLSQLIEMYDMSKNLGTDGGSKRVIGTYYSHCGLLVYLRDKKTINGDPAYTVRIIPATDDGTKSGRPVLLSQARLDELKMDKTFDSQQLCNPTPTDELKLDFSMLNPIEPGFIPKDCMKFMLIDQAGDKGTQNKTGKGDNWAFGVFAVKPQIDELGASDVHMIDCQAGQMRHDEAINNIVQMYLRNGMILQLGVEKVGLATTEIHICDALRAKRRFLSVENGNLVLLKPANRSTEQRVESGLQWPLTNGKLFYSTSIPQPYIDLIKEEMDGFPYFHVNVLNMWAYLYDMLKDFKFSLDGIDRNKTDSKFMRIFQR